MGNQYTEKPDSSPKWSWAAEVELMVSESWGQVQCYSPRLAAFSLGWLLPPRIYPHLPVSKEKASWRCCREYLWGCSYCSNENQAVVNTGNSLSPNHWAGSGWDSFSVSVATLQPFLYLINNPWLGMFYLCLQMQLIFQPDAVASQVTVTCSEHCVVPSALAHPSSSSRLQQQREYWSLTGVIEWKKPLAAQRQVINPCREASVQDSMSEGPLTLPAGKYGMCWNPVCKSCPDATCALVGTGIKNHPALLWIHDTRAVAMALCCAAQGVPHCFWSGLENLGLDFDPAKITRGEILVLLLCIHASFLFCM